MTGSDLVAAAPWIVFGIALTLLCIRLLRARRAPRRRRGPRRSRRTG